MRSALTRALMLSLGMSTTLLTPTVVSADEDNIETLVVQATRLQQQRYEVGSTVYVVDGSDLEAIGYDFVVDALAAIPGVTINQNGPFGGSASVRIRGASSDQTLVLVDGVVVNDPSSPGGGFDFSRLDPANVERIEVLSGPQSTLWGSDAIGGVVSITTKKGSQGMGGNAFIEYGSHATTRGGVTFGGGNERGDFHINLNSTDSNGISKADENNGNTEDDGYETIHVNVRGALNLPSNAKLDFSVNQSTTETEFDSFAFGQQGNVGDGDERSETDQWDGKLQLFVPSLEGKLQNTLIIGHSDIERENFNGSTQTFATEGERAIYRYLGQYQANERHHLAIGIEREETETNSTDGSITSYFGLYEVKPMDQMTITFGLRSDDIEDGERETTGSAAVAYQLTDALTLRGSWAEGFKAPTLFQTTFFCCGATVPNADLQPEESDSAEIGLDWTSTTGNTSVSATYFMQDTENQINFSFAVGGFENIDQVESEGLELSIRQNIGANLSVALGYAYIDAEDGNGNPLVRLPEQTGDLTLSYQPSEKLSLNAIVRYNDSEEDPNGRVDDWIRADLSASYKLSDKISLFGRVENVGGVEYQQILGYGTLDEFYSLGIRARF